MNDQRILAQSEEFSLVHYAEDVDLVNKRSKIKTPVGAHYGNPNCGLISPDGSWCMTGGEGVVLWLNTGVTWEGFRSRHSRPSIECLQFTSAEDAHWINSFSADRCQFVHDMKLEDPNCVRILLDPWSLYASTWSLDIKRKSLSKITDGPNLQDQPWTDAKLEF